MIKYPFLKLLLILVLILFSCKSDHQNSDLHPFKMGGTLKISCLGSLETLDPQKIMFGTDWKIASLVYEGLIEFNSISSGIEKRLVESWDKFEGGKRYVFKLRDDVFFHSDPCFPDGKGRKLVASDVYYTFLRIASKETRCPNFYLFAGRIEGIDAFNQGATDNISGITILDSTHIQFRLTRPFSSFLKTLATPAAYIIPKEAVDYYGEKIAHHPVGTGPFRLNKWKQLEYLAVIKNTNYWQSDEQGVKLPYLDGVKINLISNPVIRISEFLNGNIHLIETDEKIFLKLQEKADFSQKYRIAGQVQDITVRFFGLALNKDSPLSRETVLRRAVAHSFNRRALSQQSNSRFNISNTLVPYFFLKDSTLKWYNYNPSYAKSLVTQTHLKSFRKPVIISSNIETREAEILKKGLDEIGIQSEIDIKDMHYFTGLINNRPDIFRISFHPNYPEPEEYYFLFYSKNDFMHPISGYKNPTYDLLFEQVIVEQDEQKRRQLYLELETILKQDVPVIYLSKFSYKYTIIPLFINGVNGRLNIFDFRQVWVDASHENFK